MITLDVRTDPATGLAVAVDTVQVDVVTVGVEVVRFPLTGVEIAVPGAQGPPGPPGPPGEDGTRWWSGHGPPGDIPDADKGDYYLDLDSGDVYVVLKGMDEGDYGTMPYGTGKYGG